MSAALYLEPPLASAVIHGRKQTWCQEGRGARLPLFLLHGIGSSALAWSGQFAGFSPERAVIAWNAPGYASSEPLENAWPTALDYATTALALLDHLHITRCVLIGQSLGAVMASALALQAPARVTALILVSPASGYGVLPGAELPEKVAQRLTDLERLGSVEFAVQRSVNLLTPAASPRAHDIVRRSMAQITKQGYCQAARLLACANLRDDVARLAVRTEVIWGSADTITPPESCRRIAAAAGIAGTELGGLGHGLITEAPGRFNEAVRRLLD